jgi:hypothetical protein
LLYIDIYTSLLLIITEMSSAVSVPDDASEIPPTSANVILIGEVHSHDLGSALTTAMSLFLHLCTFKTPT